MKRHLEPALRDWFRSRLSLSSPAEFKAALAASNAREIFRLVAKASVGIREKGGNNRGPIVELMQKTLGDAEGESWCMSGVQSWIAFAETETGILSPIHASEHCLTVWRETPPAQRVRVVPAPGAVCIWRHGSTTNGHTGATLALPINRRLPLAECNTEAGNVGGHVVRDGGGCYETMRSQDGDGNMRVVGFLKPF